MKRYQYIEGKIGGDDSILVEREDGEYVKYEDVEELLNPWKDASKELPRELSRDILCKPKDIGTTHFTIRYENVGEEDEPYSKNSVELTDASGRGIEYASHWIYIPK